MTEFLVCFNWCNGEQPQPVGGCTSIIRFEVIFQLCGKHFHCHVVLISLS